MREDQLEFLRKRAPAIPPLDDSGDRPFWSVIIPTHNRVRFLPQTLESVLVQDRGPDRMHIEVADDASSQGDVKALVEEIGRGRVSYFRQPFNVGQFPNVNDAIRRARGQWLHILHDDDWIEPGFYAAFEPALAADPRIGAAMSAISMRNPDGAQMRRCKLERDTPGILEHWLHVVTTRPQVQTPAVVVRREVYETLGGYMREFSYPGDWEMWQRIAAHYEWWYDPTITACYREHGNSVTGQHRLDGHNMVEIRAVIDFVQNYIPADVAPHIKKRATWFWASVAFQTARGMIRAGNYPAAAAQLSECLRTLPNEEVVKSVITLSEQLKRPPTVVPA
jgi:hypothetical protein